MPSVATSFIRGLDFSRSREGFRGYPKNAISYGTVGHLDLTPQYARIQDGDVLVEVTLEPSGDEIVARLDTSAVDGGAVFFPLSYGQRVIVAFPGTGNGDPVIIGRCSDAAWPFPSSAAGVAMPADGSAPMFGFMRTADGQLLAVETGDGGDIVLQSGASWQAKVAATSQILLTGRTHIGTTADFAAAPVGGKVDGKGFAEPGQPAQPYAPVPNANPTIPPPLDPLSGLPLPADGVVRLKDEIQSNVAIDPAFWGWAIAVGTALTQIAAFINGLAPGTVVPPGPPPSTLTSLPASSSANTVADG